MDPTANLHEQLEVARRIQAKADSGSPVEQHDAVRLAELCEALDGWLRRGGFLPADWTATSTRTPQRDNATGEHSHDAAH